MVTCYPCPHGAACCSYGVDLIGDELDAIRKHHGDAAVVWDEEEASWRTSVVDDKCFFLRDGLCSIHAAPYYPRTCRGFPYTDGETGGPYLYDQTICPDFT